MTDEQRSQRGWIGSVIRSKSPGRWTNGLFRIRYRLLLVNVLVVAVPILGIGFARTFEREMLVALEDDMIHQAQLVREMVLFDPTGARLDARGPMLAQAARGTRTRIRIVDPAGQVVADSHRRGPPEGAEKPAPQIFGWTDDTYHPPEKPRPIDISSRPEIETALAGRYGSATRLWENRHRVYLFAALPIIRGARPGDPDAGEVLGAVYVTRSTAPVKFAMFRLRTWLLWVFGVSLAVTAVLSLFLSATISRPLTRLTRIAKRIAAGDRSERLSSARRDEIGQLSRVIDAMTERLDARARYTSELAANISHEFKSPLTSIRGAAELLRDGAVDDVPARDKFLANIISDTHRLDRLVTRLLELSRFEADDAPRTYFDYEALVREVIEQKRELAAQLPAGDGHGDDRGHDDAPADDAPADDAPADAPGLEIQLSYRSRTTQLHARRGHIASVLGNLIDNALQHADPGTAIKVGVSDGPEGTVRTAIHNVGPVISPAAAAHIWDRFFTTRAKQGGTGLGLAIVSSIVEGHGGATAVTSDSELGTTFSFDLPPP